MGVKAELIEQSVKLHKAVRDAYKAGLITREEAREILRVEDKLLGQYVRPPEDQSETTK